MRIQFSILIWALGLISSAGAIAETSPAPDIEVLRAEIAALRQEYETRIRELEQRVAAAEQKPQVVAAVATPLPPAAESRTQSAANNAFNPALAACRT